MFPINTKLYVLQSACYAELYKCSVDLASNSAATSKTITQQFDVILKKIASISTLSHFCICSTELRCLKLIGNTDFSTRWCTLPFCL